MHHILIVGGGLAGCTTALELAQNGVACTILEQSETIGGKVRNYGCKSTDKCLNCGVCLAAGLWEKVENNPNIRLMYSAKLVDVRGKKGCFTATIRTPEGTQTLEEDFAQVVLATGFSPTTLENFNGFAELEGSQGLITGSTLEQLFKGRTQGKLFETPPSRVAFIQCYGSRDCREHAMYCSRVCCNYATRAARAIKYAYPDCQVVFFYMEMQMVEPGNYFQSLKDAGIKFMKCRPIQITGGHPAAVTYDNPATGKRETQSFDLVVLSDGIRPTQDAPFLAEICGMGQDEAGFLQPITGNGGIHVTGCAQGPKKIEETYHEAVTLAKVLCNPV